MLDTIISSKTRLKLLIKFFLFEGNRSYLRSLEREFHESTNAIRIELNRFEDAGLLISNFESNRKYYMANSEHPLYKDIMNIVRKTIGIDQIIDKVISKVGDLISAYIIGDFARGIDSGTIELVMVGNNLDTDYIEILVKKAEDLINRKIMYMILTPDQMEYFFKEKPVLPIWEAVKWMIKKAHP